MGSSALAPSVGALLANAAKRWPGKTALIFGERALTFGKLDKASSLVAHALEQRGLQLAAHKVPRAFLFVDDVPKTSTGKVLRRPLRQLDQTAAST